MTFKRTPDPKIRKQLIAEGFNFSYAGRLRVYISPNKKVGWCLHREGFRYDFELKTVFFDKNIVEKSSSMPLYEAIKQFNLHVSEIISSGLDWYNSEAFDYDTLFREHLASIYF